MKQYFYIDEAGTLNGNSKYFILGCYQTDEPEKIRTSLEVLKFQIENDPYFAFERKKFLKDSFHACENHFDIRSRFYSRLSTLNFRAYFVVMDKESREFNDLKNHYENIEEIYNYFISKLMKDRIMKNRNDELVVVFEEYGKSILSWTKNVKESLSQIIDEIYAQYGFEVDVSCLVHSKKDLNLSVTDYLNYLLVHVFEHEKLQKRMKENFYLIEPKIGSINKIDSKEYFHLNNRLRLP